MPRRTRTKRSGNKKQNLSRRYRSGRTRSRRLRKLRGGTLTWSGLQRELEEPRTLPSPTLSEGDLADLNKELADMSTGKTKSREENLKAALRTIGNAVQIALRD